MTPMHEPHSPPLSFDPLTIAIKGTNLIEASAGTGKTWSIAALFLRLILVEKMDVAQILVVTYTRAATAELKSRLRSRLAEALAYLQNPDTVFADDFLLRLFTGLHYPVSEQILRLQAALNHFDKATIYTIHSFCQRVLQEYAFICGSPFEVELVNENDKVLLMLTEDFWRQEIIHQPLWAKLVFENNLSPADALEQVKTVLSKPYLVYSRPESTLDNALEAFNTTWALFSEQQIIQLTKQFWTLHPCLNGNIYRKTTYETVFQQLLQLTQAVHTDAFTLSHLKIEPVLKLTSAALLSNLKKNQVLSEETEKIIEAFHCFDDLCSALTAFKLAQENELSILKFKLYEFLNQSVQNYKQSHQQRRFDDLLLDLYLALQQTEQGKTLAHAVAHKWQVALIDEFQDTDPIQYHIFQHVFAAHQRPLFLVGDPKQAIYKFRGADIFAYLHAAKEAEHHYSLSTNFRTHQVLLGHITQIFQSHPNPFVFKEISYSNVQANRQNSEIQPDGHSLSIQWLEDDKQPQQALNKDVARDLAARACAGSIAWQLTQAQEGKLHYQGQALLAKDIAVLVSTHNQGKLIRDRLKALNIDSVNLSQESVFASAEAEALLILLNCWLKPTHSGHIINLLASLLFQYSASELYALKHNEHDLLRLIGQMQNYQTIWQKKGIFSAYQRFSQEHQITEQMLNRAQERSLTNITQLLELLAEEESSQFGMHTQISWLAAQIQYARQGRKSEATQLRLESDEGLVKIITIHSAKGLQYPVVYCPFVWDTRQFAPTKMTVVHKNNQNCLLSEQQLSAEDRQMLEQEDLAEKLRLLYVAMTRAKEQLILTTGNISGVQQSALTYLLVDKISLDKKADIAPILKQKLIELAQNNSVEWVDNIATEQGFQADDLSQTHFSARTFSGQLDYGKTVSSFSSLSSFTQIPDDEISPEQPNIGKPVVNTGEADKQLNSFMLPKGNKTGLFLHSILERLDFQSDANLQLPLIERNLVKYHFESHWQDTVINLLNHTAHALLDSDFTLAQCLPTQQLSEMNFTFDAHQFSPERLYQALTDPLLNLPPQICYAAKKLDFATLNGYCNGFIDLIVEDSRGEIYVIDYKSNHLGEQAEYYQGHYLDEAIAEHHYYLQAMLYSIATYRYFKQRKRNIKCVHVRYLFLRGLHKHSHNGIWSWDIDEANIKRLSSTLMPANIQNSHGSFKGG